MDENVISDKGEKRRSNGQTNSRPKHIEWSRHASSRVYFMYIGQRAVTQSAF